MAYRYNRRLLVRELDSLTPAPNTIGVLTIDEGSAFPRLAEVMQYWMHSILESCTAGLRADFSVLPSFAGLNRDSPRTDPRWKMLSWAEGMLDSLIQAGRVVVGVAKEHHEVAAFQIIRDEGVYYARINEAVDGVFYSIAKDAHLELGWELDAEDRDRAGHVTVLYGEVYGQLHAMIFWNLDALNLNMPAGEHLVRLMDQSIGVRNVRERWFRERSRVTPEEIQGALAIAVKEGVHPDERGTYMAKLLIGDKPIPEVPISALPGERGRLLLESITDEQGDDPPDAAARQFDGARAKEVIAKLRLAAGPDERILLDAWLEALKTEDVGVTALARSKGWDPAAVEAVRKRIARDLAKDD
jgi:hypothetical protein